MEERERAPLAQLRDSMASTLQLLEQQQRAPWLKAIQGQMQTDVHRTRHTDNYTDRRQEKRRHSGRDAAAAPPTSLCLHISPAMTPPPEEGRVAEGETEGEW